MVLQDTASSANTVLVMVYSSQREAAADALPPHAAAIDKLAHSAFCTFSY